MSSGARSRRRREETQRLQQEALESERRLEALRASERDSYFHLDSQAPPGGRHVGATSQGNFAASSHRPVPVHSTGGQTPRSTLTLNTASAPRSVSAPVSASTTSPQCPVESQSATVGESAWTTDTDGTASASTSTPVPEATNSTSSQYPVGSQPGTVDEGQWITLTGCSATSVAVFHDPATSTQSAVTEAHHAQLPDELRISPSQALQREVTGVSSSGISNEPPRSSIISCFSSIFSCIFNCSRQFFTLLLPLLLSVTLTIFEGARCIIRLLDAIGTSRLSILVPLFLCLWPLSQAFQIGPILSDFAHLSAQYLGVTFTNLSRDFSSYSSSIQGFFQDEFCADQVNPHAICWLFQSSSNTTMSDLLHQVPGSCSIFSYCTITGREYMMHPAYRSTIDSVIDFATTTEKNVLLYPIMQSLGYSTHNIYKFRLFLSQNHFVCRDELRMKSNQLVSNATETSDLLRQYLSSSLSSITVITSWTHHTITDLKAIDASPPTANWIRVILGRWSPLPSQKQQMLGGYQRWLSILEIQIGNMITESTVIVSKFNKMTNLISEIEVKMTEENIQIITEGQDLQSWFSFKYLIGLNKAQVARHKERELSVAISFGYINSGASFLDSSLQQLHQLRQAILTAQDIIAQEDLIFRTSTDRVSQNGRTAPEMTAIQGIQEGLRALKRSRRLMEESGNEAHRMALAERDAMRSAVPNNWEKDRNWGKAEEAVLAWGNFGVD